MLGWWQIMCQKVYPADSRSMSDFIIVYVAFINIDAKHVCVCAGVLLMSGFCQLDPNTGACHVDFTWLHVKCTLDWCQILQQKYLKSLNDSDLCFCFFISLSHFTSTSWPLFHHLCKYFLLPRASRAGLVGGGGGAAGAGVVSTGSGSWVPMDVVHRASVHQLTTAPAPPWNPQLQVPLATLTTSASESPARSGKGLKLVGGV